MSFGMELGTGLGLKMFVTQLEKLLTVPSAYTNISNCPFVYFLECFILWGHVPSSDWGWVKDSQWDKGDGQGECWDITWVTRQTHFQFSSASVTQSCLTLCDPMDCSMPGFSVFHQFLELVLTQCPLSQCCHPTISYSVLPFSSCLQSFPASGSFQMSQSFTLGGQNIGVSASAWMNIQDWFPLGLTGLISLQSKGLSRVFSNTTVQKHQFFSAQLSL